MAVQTSASIFLKGIDQTGKAVKAAVANLGQIKTAADKASKTLRNVFELGTTVAVLKKVVKLSKEYFNNITDPKVSASFERLKKVANEYKNAFKGIVDQKMAPLLDNMATKLESARGTVENILNAVSGVFSNLPEALGIMATTLAQVISGIFSFNNFKTLIVDLHNALVSMVQSIAQIAVGYADYFIAKLSDLFWESDIGAFFKKLNEKQLNANGSNYLKMKQARGFDIITQSSDRKTADEVLAELGDIVTKNVKSVKTSFSTILTDFGDIIEPYMSDMTDKLGKLNNGSKISIASGSSSAGTASNNFIDKLSSSLANKFIKLTTNSETGNSRFTADQMSSAVSTVLNNFTSSLGKAGTVANELATNMASMGPVLGAIVTALKYVFEGIGEVLVDILDDFVEYGLEPLREFGRMIGGFIKPVLEELMPLVRDSADFAIRLFKMVGVVLKPIIEIISSALTPIISSLSHVFEAITPVLKIFAKVLVTITGTFQYIVQVLQHWVASVMNWLASIKIFGSHPFKNLAMSDPGSPGSYGSFIKNKWSEIDAAFEASASDGIASGTSVSSASYQGATNVTINIYQEAPVVGDPGMRQFAQMIRNEFEKLDYYGVTA